MIQNKTIALIAHDRRKVDMIDWVKYNAEVLVQNNLVCTGTTGNLIEETLIEIADQPEFLPELNEINIILDKKLSGPLGGDAEIAAMVVNKEIDFCVFFIDDLNPNPHEADIQMLLRQCRIHNIPVACNRATADFIISSELWKDNYISTKPTYIEYDRK